MRNAKPPDQLKCSFVDCPICHARIDEAADDRFPNAARCNPLANRRDLALEEFVMKRAFGRHPQMRRSARVHAQGGLKRGVPVNGQEGLFRHRLSQVTPGIEESHDLFRQTFLHDNKRIW